MRKFILNEFFGIVALIILLIPQVAHTVYVFKVNSQYDQPWFSWCYAIGVDLAILIFTVKGWIRTAVVYAIGTLAQNLVYQFWPETVWSAILLSVMLSGTLFSFSHLFYFRESTDSANSEAFTENALRLTTAIEKGIHFEPQPYVCPTCGDSFSSAKKLNGHISGHKQKGEWDESKYPNFEQENEQRAAVLSQLFINGHVQGTDKK